jgi:hypothetical protein
MPTFPYKTAPMYPEQREILRASAPQFAHYLQMEQGTGKTWVAINTAAFLAMRGAIDAVIVCAPNGVHTQWAIEQIPQHMPDVVPYATYVWRSERETRERGKRTRDARKSGRSRISPLSDDFRAFVADDAGALAIFCVNTEAVGTVQALDSAVMHMLRARRCLLILDEASDYASPSTARTRTVWRWARLAKFRRCLDGTPTNGLPWDMWAAYRFLSPRIISYAPTYKAMKDAHGEWFEWERVPGARPVPLLKKTSDGKPVLKDLDILAKTIAPVTSRVTKAQVLKHLPPKCFSTTFFDLTTAQTEMMRTLRRELQVTIADGAIVTADHVLTLQLRLQQIACGFVPTDVPWGSPDDAPQPVHWLIPEPIDNPRVRALMDALERRPPTHYPTIIWARYHLDIDMLQDVLRARGYRVGVYDGRVPPAQRDATRAAFQFGDIDVFLGNAAAGAKGLNLYRASSVVYYANYFGLRRRLQSEDRAHRIGTTEPVHYIDLVGLPPDLQPTSKRALRESPDWTVLQALRTNKSVADLLTGDAPLTEWI